MNALNQPISQCEKCDELFCKNCIDKNIKINNNCPKCRLKPFINKKIGRKLITFMNNYVFNCPLKCGSIFGLADLEIHKDSCKQLEVYQCSLCKEKLLENQQNLKLNHQNKCEKLKISCAYCKMNLSIFDYKNHLQICEESLNYCKNCNLMVCKKYQEAHSRMFCPHIQKLSLLIKNIERY